MGNQTFAQHYDALRGDDTRPVVNGSDIIASVPPPGFYWHVAEKSRVQLRGEKEAKIGGKLTGLPKFSDHSLSSKYIPHLELLVASGQLP